MSIPVVVKQVWRKIKDFYHYPVDFRISTANKKHYNWDVKSKVDPVDLRVIPAKIKT